MNNQDQAIEFTGSSVTSEQAQRFQDLLRSRRTARFGTQTEAAKGAGVSQTLISTLERGPHTGMRMIDLFKVLQAYDIEPNEVAAILGYYSPTKGDDAQPPRIRHLVGDLSRLPPDRLGRALDMMDVMLRGLGE